MSSSHGYRSALLAWTLLAGALAGVVGCSDASDPDAVDGVPSPAGAASDASAGRLIDARDAEGHRYREVPEEGAPKVDIVVQPDASGTGDGWELRLTVRHFRFTPAAEKRRTAVAGRGQVELSLDGRRLAVLHAPRYHLPAKLLSRGTHQITACLYADDRTVWAVDGEPVESTAPLTASDPTPTGNPGGDAKPTGGEGAGAGRDGGGDAAGRTQAETAAPGAAGARSDSGSGGKSDRSDRSYGSDGNRSGRDDRGGRSGRRDGSIGGSGAGGTGGTGGTGRGGVAGAGNSAGGETAGGASGVSADGARAEGAAVGSAS